MLDEWKPRLAIAKEYHRRKRNEDSMILSAPKKVYAPLTIKNQSREVDPEGDVFLLGPRKLCAPPPVAIKNKVIQVDFVDDETRSAPINTCVPPAVKKNVKEEDELEESSAMGHEMVQVDGRKHVLVTFKRRFATAVQCPCAMNCGCLVRVGKYASYAATGHEKCPHCGAGGGYLQGFKCFAQLRSHVNTQGCKRKQGILVETMTPKSELGEEYVYRINNPKNKFRKNDKVRFRCPECEKEVDYHMRYQHCVKCWRKSE